MQTMSLSVVVTAVTSEITDSRSESEAVSQGPEHQQKMLNVVWP